MLSKWRPSCSPFSSRSCRREASSCCSRCSRSCPMRSCSPRSPATSFSSRRQDSSRRASSWSSSSVSARSICTNLFSASMRASKCSTGGAESAAPIPAKRLLPPPNFWRAPKSGLRPPPPLEVGLMLSCVSNAVSCGGSLLEPFFLLLFDDLPASGGSANAALKTSFASAVLPSASQAGILSLECPGGDEADGPRSVPQELAGGSGRSAMSKGLDPLRLGGAELASNNDAAEDISIRRGDREACAAYCSAGPRPLTRLRRSTGICCWICCPARARRIMCMATTNSGQLSIPSRSASDTSQICANTSPGNAVWPKSSRALSAGKLGPLPAN
mmetsp:Transcript_79547/g.223530  ORF Transcript_79547/g.223530 Transcript_79547/m.223530 type:complete len:330 (-) Transcript_79547:501-1490(-)